MIDFTSGANPLGPSNKARNAIRGRVRDVSAFSARHLDRLKAYIAKKEGIEKACIAFGCGSTAILNTVLEITKPKKVLIPYPFSHGYSSILERQNLERATIVLKADESFDLNVDDFCNALQGCNAAIISNPHDVTGSILPTDDVTYVTDEADRLGIHLFIDESYGEYTGIPSLAVRVVQSRRTLILRTFSTFHALAGLRLGYVIGSPDFVSMVENKLDPSWINSFAPWAAIASMKDKGYRRRTLLFIEGEKTYLRERLPQIPGVKCYVSPSNILVVRVQKDHTELSGSFKKHHVLVHTFADEDGNTCIRFPVQTHRLNAYFVRILKRMMEA